MGLFYRNGADCFRHSQLLNGHVVSIPTLRAYLPLGGATERWPEPRVVSIAEVSGIYVTVLFVCLIKRYI